MNKGQLIDAIAKRTTATITKKQIDEIVSETFEAIQDAVTADDKVTLVGFGSFELRDRAEREGRNPSTGEKMTIAACKSVGFSAGKGFKERVNS